MNKSKVKIFCCCLTLSIVFFQSHAYVDKNAFDKLIAASEIVAHVRINASRVNYASIGDKVISCGISYTINVIESFKGTLSPASAVTIFGRRSLKTDADYLLFLTSARSGVLEATPKAAENKCLQYVSPIRFSSRFYMEIIEDSGGKGYPHAHRPLLAKHEDFSFPIPPEMGMFTRNYEFCDDSNDIGSDTCSTWKRTSFLDWDKLSNYIRKLRIPVERER